MSVSDKVFEAAYAAWHSSTHTAERDVLREAIEAAFAAQEPAPAPVAVQNWRHKARGTVYSEIGRGRMQVQDGTFLGNECPVVIYRGGDGQLWARAVDEFEDGRFEMVAAPIPAAPAAQGRTVDVRVAVAVDSNGAWRSEGEDGVRDDDLWHEISLHVSDGASRYWLTATLAVPAVAEVAAGVEGAQS